MAVIKNAFHAKESAQRAQMNASVLRPLRFARSSFEVRGIPLRSLRHALRALREMHLLFTQAVIQK
jgi:hypothetical protein